MAMRKKSEIDYIYFSECTTKKGVRLGIKQEAGIHVLQVKAGLPLKKRKIKRLLKKYQLNHSAFGADIKMAEQLELNEMLFQARKQELMRERERIFLQFKGKCERDKRHSMLIMLGSREWSHKDLLSILVTAKDYYEDISIAVKADYIGVEQLAETMYEEWGVVLHLLQKEDSVPENIDFVLFLLEKWERSILEQYNYQNAYLVLEMEETRLKRRYAEKWGMPRVSERKKKYLYSGLAYETEGKKLPYQMSVDIAYQNPLLYEEFSLSSVAIYRLEW